MSMFKTLALAALTAIFMTGMAFAAPDDEVFVQTKANQALAILADDTLDQAAKTVAFRDFVNDITDVPRIARFVLGKYARGADPDKLAAFTKTFDDYASGVYENQLGNFSGESLEVTGSQDRKPGDSVVTSVITGGKFSEPVKMNWRVRTRNERKQVLDVQVFGIWVALQQRTEITAVIANHGGDIEAATDVLKARIVNGDFGTEDENSAEN